ncbi:MAG: arabinosyltransferase domain-containing protein, partial [Tomitella sp.]|nr:arabinosyltransferase domain-containing protein [Tomitella sp.]
MPTAVTDNSSAPPDDPRPRTRADLRTARLIAAVTGLVGFVLAVLTPLLPVSQTTVDLNWPQNGSLEAVNAPATSYQPISLDATIPCSAIADVVDQGPGAHDVLSTAPGSAGPDAHKRAMFVTVNDNQVQVRTRNSLVAQAPTDAVTAPGACSGLHITSDAEHTAAEFVGLTNADGAPLAGSVDGDKRPQLVGVYTDMTGGVPDGLQFSAEIDSRWSTTPTLLKGLAMIFAVALTITSLVALSRFDATDGRRNRRFLPARWWHFDLKDGLVISVLVLWHFIGANTADDGYIMTMARAAEHSGYMSNYYRWFAAPEAPFGMSYYIFTGLSHISTASPLLRLPALIAGILCWMVISREVIPRLGRLARRRNLVLWTSGLVFLAFWLSFNNGLRPEPYIALGALLTWCSVERAIATRRVMPIVGALLIASFTLSVGPTGTICVAALIAGSRPMLQII